MYETYAGLSTDDVIRLIRSYQRDFHIAANPNLYADDPAFLPPESRDVVLTEGNVARINYWCEDMQALMAKSIPRVESLLDEAFRRARSGDLYITEEVLIESLSDDVARYLDMLMDGPPTCLGDILFKADDMCFRLNL